MMGLEMGPEPNKDWGVTSEHPQVNDVETIVTTPYINDTKKIFMDEEVVSLACDTESAKIYYCFKLESKI